MATVPTVGVMPEQDSQPSQPSVLADAIQQTQDRQRQDFVSTLQTVSQVNPDQFAKATEVSKLSGIPADVLHQHAADMDALLKGNRYAAVYDNYQRTAEALSHGPTAAIAQDDIDNLTRIEHAREATRFNDQSTGEKLFGALSQGWKGAEQGGAVSYADRLQRLKGQFDKVDQEVSRATLAGEQPYGDGNTPVGFGLDYLNANPEQRTEMRQRLLGNQSSAISTSADIQQDLAKAPTEPGAMRYQELGGDASAMAQAIAQNPGYAARAAVGSLASSAPMLVAGALGGPLAAGAVELGTEYDAKMVDVLQAANVNLADPKAVLAALQDDKLMESARLKASRKAIGTTAVDVLGMSVAGRLLIPKTIGGKALTGVQREGLNIVAQAPVQAAFGAASEAAGQYAADQKISGGDVLMEAVAGAAMSSVDVATFGGGRVLDNIQEGLRGSRQARQGKAALDEMAAAATESKTRARDPDTFNAVAEQQLRGSDLETISIPAEALASLNQDGAPPVLDGLLARVPGLTEQFAEAAARGGSVQMKTADYLTAFAEHHEALANSVRTQVDGMSVEESQQWQESQAQQIDELAASMQREPDAMDDAYVGLMSELQQAGYRRGDAEQYATLHLSALNTLAQRSGKTLPELMQRFPLDIRNKAPDSVKRIPVDDMRLALGRLRTGDIPKPRDLFGKTLGEYLRDAGGINDEGGELAALDTDVGKVGRNRIIKREGGMSLDDAAMQAWERGYFPGVPREEVGPQLIVDAMQGELAGNPTYSVEQENATLRDQATNLQNLQEYLDQLGVNLNELDDDQVLAILRDPESVEGVQLNQAGTTRQQLVERLTSEYPGIKLDLMGNGDVITLSRIVIPEGARSAGTGTKVMQAITDWADANGKRVALTPSGDFGGNKKRLGEFYKRFGFVENKGKAKDYEISEAMYREPRLNQSGSEQQPRGYITFNEPKDGSQRKFQITVTGRRDLSTLLHEFGHFYLEVVADLATDADANPQMVADLQAIREWTGAAPTGPFEVAQHEQFARGFEAYLADGKAPNPEIQGAFSRFKRWIISIYKDLRRLNVELTPEIRGVMDRIVATDEQIRNAEQVSQALPLFESAQKAGMTDAEFAAYRNQVELAHDEAQTTVEQQIIREEERRRSKWWAEESERVRKEVAEELDLLPGYQAQKALRAGVMPDGSPTTIKLHSAEIKEQYGNQVLRKLAFMHSKTGAPLEVVANGLGFTSGDEMIKEMLGLPSRSEYEKTETQTRMEERYGPKSSGEAADRAMSAVHNEKRGAVLIRELNALGKQGNRKNITANQTLKLAAERIMQDRKVRDVQPFEYQRAEATAGRKAFEAAAKGDLVAAYEAKQQQLLNFHLWREAKKAREQIDTVVDRMAKLGKAGARERIGKAGGDYLDQIDAIMEQYEFRTVSLRQIDKRKSFAAWYADQVAAGNDPFVPEFVLNSQGRTNYKDLSLAQLNELDEFAQNITHLASLKNKLLRNKRIKDIQEAQQLMARSAFDNVAKAPVRQIVDNARSLPEVVRDWLKNGNSSLLKMEQVIEWLDGGDANGAWSTLIFQPLAEAQHERDKLNQQYSKKVVDLTNQWIADRGTSVGKIFSISSLPGQRMTTNGMLAVALNVGNASNHQKLLKGRGWAQHTVDEILGHMTEADWKYVKSMWETVESLWPQIEALEKRVNGVAPEKIEALTVKTPWGEVTGGYWPLVYDPTSTQYADVVKNLGDLAPLSNAGTVRATPPRGHTKARVDNFAAPILLDAGVIGNHLHQVIHDLTHREVLADTRRLISGEAREAVVQTLGPEMAAQLNNMLDGIANDQASGDSKAISVFSSVMNKLRSNQAAAWMGYSVTTMFNQLGGYAQALDYFAQKGGRAHMVRAMVKFWGSPVENARMIRAMSGEMEHRALNLDVSIRQAQQGVVRMKDGRTVQDWFKTMQNGQEAMVRYAFVPIQVMQSVVDSVVWMAGYEMEGGALNHEQAVAGADRAVRLTQTAGGAKDMATIQQSNLAKLFMPVYGYASLLWNRNVDIARSAGQGIKERSPKQVLVAFERFVYLNILPALLSGAIKGSLPDDDDDDKKPGWSHYLAVQSLLGVASGVPLAGTVAQGFFGDFGYSGASAIGQGFDAAIKAMNASKGQTISTQAVSAVGAFTGLPASQINRAVRTGFMVEDGSLDDSALAVTRALLFGPPSKN